MKKIFNILFLLFFAFSVIGQTKQIDNLQKQQKILREEISNTNKLFLNVKKHTTTILERLNLINKQISSRKEMISLQRQEIVALERQQTALEKEIEKLNEELKQKQEKYTKAVKTLQIKRQSENKLFFVLSGKSLGESLRRMQYLKNYSKWRKQQAEDIKAKNKELTAKKEALIKSKNEKQKALAAVEAEQKKLQQEEEIRQREVAEAKGKQKELQQELQKKQQQAQKLDAQIEKLIAEEVARLEREAEARRLAAEAEKRRKAEEAAAKARQEEEARKKGKTKRKESKKDVELARAEPSKSADVAKPVIDAEKSTVSDASFALSKNFSANKGKLPMPVTGPSTIVTRFGVNKHEQYNISTNSNGVDIQAQKGADIRSVFDGQVTKVFSFPGSNTCVIISHGEYFSFYDNIYNIYVKQGDKVKTGQSIGQIYTDPDTGLAKMHFQLWQKNTKLNPSAWLRH